MKISREWIDAHRSNGRSFTAAQKRALGTLCREVQVWRSGWIDRLIGRELTDEQASAFERGKHIFSKATRNRHDRQAQSERQVQLF